MATFGNPKERNEITRRPSLKASAARMIVLLLPRSNYAQDGQSEDINAAPVPSTRLAVTPSVSCASTAGGRTHCAADPSAGVELQGSTGTLGYYVGGQKGTTVSAAFSVFF
jgi:hypothetical protein